MRIETNFADTKTMHDLYKNEKHTNTKMERFTNEQHIHSGADDTANIAIVSRVDAKQGINVSIQNNENTLVMLRSADSSLQSITNILLRMRDLAVQAAHDKNSSDTRFTLEKKFQEHTKQIGYMQNVTTLHTIPIFEENQNHSITIDVPFSSINKVQFSQQENNSPSPTETNIKISTKKDAQTAIAKIDYSLQKIALHRADLGALINRLQLHVDHLNNQTINIEENSSRIENTNVAQKMSGFVKDKLLTEVACSMVSQTNQVPQMIIKLLYQ
ncbi:flagellin [Bacillus sp. S13(2024)]|uniref:flagellin n=1 Tax=unclassified Bacillus (in: firmicutes) TaxID=185979 RepID=UPI003D2559B7